MEASLTQNQPAGSMDQTRPIQSVLVTGATGFVGRQVVRALLARGLTPVCLVRDRDRFRAQHADVNAERLVPIVGGLGDKGPLREAADRTQAVIHLAGIIIERVLRGRTFHRVHVRGTRRVVDAAARAGIRRFVHMSALGTRPDAGSRYHQTKWQAEQYVCCSGLDWTVFRPSLIHGPRGEFMQLMKAFVCGFLPPVIPYFGDGSARIQPVVVKDVARCLVEALFVDDSVGRIVPLGGPRAYTWIELYEACRATMPRARHFKPLVSMPVALARVVAAVSAPPMSVIELLLPRLGKYRFDAGQVRMATEDSVCDHTIAEEMFGIRMRGFEEELATYADQIR